MRKQKFLSKIIITTALLSSCFLGLVLTYYDRANVSSGNCASGHGTASITLTTNYSGNAITIGQGQTFDIELTAVGQNTGSVWIGYAFWHTGSDSIAIPSTAPFTAEDNLQNEWTDGSDYYACFAWQTVVDPMTRTFRITPTNSPTTETLTIQIGGDNDRRSNVIAFSITVIAPDYDIPNVTITAPANDAYVGGSSVSITATADDGAGSGVDTVWAEITNVTYSEIVSMAGTEPNYAGTWDSTVVDDGTYTLAVMANDSLGQLNNTESITINVDNNAPSITIDSITPNPSNGLTVITASNNSADIDGNGIRAVVSPPTGGDIYLDLAYQGSNIWNNSFTVTQTGSYDVTINATDIASNTAVVGPTVLTGDVTDPNVVITSPLEGQKVGGIVSISGTASGSGSNIVSMYINNTIWGDGSQAPNSGTAIGNPAGTFSFDNKTFIPPGYYWVEVNITDAAGNFNSSVRYFNMTDEDMSPPQITLTATPDPSNGFTNITVITNEALDSAPLLNITLPSSSVVYKTMYLVDTLTWCTNYTVASNGDFKIDINATDTSLNTGYSTLNFTGDITVPTLTLSVAPNPSNGLTVIEAYNTTEVVTSIQANISTPSGFLYETLVYQGANKWNGSFILTENGVHVIEINGSDTAGNYGYKSVGITGDIVGPSIAIDTVTPNPSNATVFITASNATNDINAEGLKANITTPGGGEIYVNLTLQTGTSIWKGNFTVTEDGAYNVYINATDVLGNYTIVGPTTIYGDFTDPEITINSPSGDFGNAPPDFDLTIIEYAVYNSWYKIFDGITWSNSTSFTGTTGTIDPTLWSSTNNGELIIRFYINDTFGNIGYADEGIFKAFEAEAEETDAPLQVSEDQLFTISTLGGLMIIAGFVVILIVSDRKRVR